MPRVLFTAAARADLAEALDWFDAHAPNAIPHFRQALRAVVTRIAENPKQFPAASPRTRRALLRHFPYLIIFREANDAAYVVAVFHASRNPATWRQRS